VETHSSGDNLELIAGELGFQKADEVGNLVHVGVFLGVGIARQGQFELWLPLPSVP
jgi:hypothetical protein